MFMTGLKKALARIGGGGLDRRLGSASAHGRLENAAARTCGRIIQAMPTPCAENWTLLPPWLLLATLAWLFWPSVTQAVDYGNEVTVWIEQGQVRQCGFSWRRNEWFVRW